MRNQIFNYSISASSISSSQIAPEKIQAELEKIGLKHILVECLLDFEATVETYPDKEIAGFARRCEIWLLHRGSDDTAQNWLRAAGSAEVIIRKSLRKPCMRKLAVMV